MTQPVMTRPTTRQPAAATPAVRVRPWRAGDQALIAAAESRISPASFFARFFTGSHRFPPRYLDRLVATVCVVAVCADLRDSEAGEEIIGWAEIARRGDSSYAGDLGVLVVDAWQRRRVGPALVRAVLDAARRRGVSVVHADVLETNTAARRALARTFGDLPVTYDGEVLTYVLPLVPALPVGTDTERGAS